jgi:AAA+ ATPase superfamily predicted ATPase
MKLIGRILEIEKLTRLLNSEEAEFLAIYGRRRVGKTFLIEQHFKKPLCFQLNGQKDGTLKEQLTNFDKALSERSRKKRVCPTSWQEAFQQLEAYLKCLSGKSKRVVFLDELPWLASPRSRFLQALDYFWNSFISKDPRFKLVICGSAASWMISKVLNEKGGLHNRVTARMKLEPFTVAESAQFLKSRGVKLTAYDHLTLTSVMGGVPYYLKEVQPGQSAVQVIDATCFSETGLLRDEFKRLYRSLFDKSERHVEIVRELAKHPQGLTRKDLTKIYKTGGRLSDSLTELNEASFISIQNPFEKNNRDAIYRLSDEYSLFYLKWIDGKRGTGSFAKKFNTPAWRAWSGYALESIAQKHIHHIKAELGIAQIDTEYCSWVHRANTTWPQGSQVDLLIDRADRSINLIEIKFSEGPFTINKSYAQELRRKVQVFKDVTGTQKNIFLTFLTTHGLTPNAYANELADVSITTECLFK